MVGLTSCCWRSMRFSSSSAGLKKSETHMRDAATLAQIRLAQLFDLS